MKTVCITGIGRGIGKAVALKFLSEGYTVFGTSQTGAVDFSHDNLEVFTLDLSDPVSIEKCAREIRAEGLSVIILINNAGALFDEDDTSVHVDKLRKTLEVNLIGTIDFTERLIPTIASGGHIVNISSSAGSLHKAEHDESHFPFHYPAYKISKTALNMYTVTLARRLVHEKTGITVSSVHPGWVKTDMGGTEAPVTPEEAATDICALASSRPETGMFWYKGKKIEW